MCEKHYKCNICQKEGNEFWDIFGIEICEDCFTTLVRVSQYKNPKDILPEELETMLTYQKKLLSQILKDKDSEDSEEVKEQENEV